MYQIFIKCHQALKNCWTTLLACRNLYEKYYSTQDNFPLGQEKQIALPESKKKKKKKMK